MVGERGVVRSETRGSPAKVKWDRPKDRLNPARMDKDILRILELVVEIRHVWEQAVDGGAYPGRTGSNGRGTGFTDLKPVESAVFPRPKAGRIGGLRPDPASAQGYGP